VAVQPVGAHRSGIPGAHRRQRRTEPRRWLLTTVIALATVAVLASGVALVATLLTASAAPHPRQSHPAGGGRVPQAVVASSSGIRIHSTG
jgi:hypothetical protein